MINVWFIDIKIFSNNYYCLTKKNYYFVLIETTNDIKLNNKRYKIKIGQNTNNLKTILIIQSKSSARSTENDLVNSKRGDYLTLV